VRKDLKERRHSQDDVAAKTGYKTRQSISGILSSDKYMTADQARRFADAFGYNPEYLTEGKGSLRPEEETHEDKKLSPEGLLDLPRYDDQESFEAAFTGLIDTLMAMYGDEFVRQFLADVLRYVTLCVDPRKDRTLRLMMQALNTRPNPSESEKAEIEEKTIRTPAAQKYIENSKKNVLERLYQTYGILTEI